MKLNEMLDMLGELSPNELLTEMPRTKYDPVSGNPIQKSVRKSLMLRPDWLRTKNTFKNGTKFPAYFTKYDPKSVSDYEYYNYVGKKGASKFSQIPLNIAETGRKDQPINKKGQDSVLDSMSVIMRDALGFKKGGYTPRLTNTTGGNVSTELFNKVKEIFADYTKKVRNKKYTEKNKDIPLFNWQDLKREIEGILVSDDISEKATEYNEKYVTKGNGIDAQIPYNIKTTGHGANAPTIASFMAHKAVLALQDKFGLKIDKDGVIEVYGNLQTYLQAAGVENGMYTNIGTTKAEQDAVMTNGNTAYHDDDVGARTWSTTD